MFKPETDEQQYLDTFKSLVTIFVEGVKYLLLINGGACVAILAYLGKASRPPENTAAVEFPMACFITGIVACGAVIGLAHLTQFRLLNELRDGSRRRHMTWAWLAAAFFALSILAFTVGAWQAVKVFK